MHLQDQRTIPYVLNLLITRSRFHLVSKLASLSLVVLLTACASSKPAADANNASSVPDVVSSLQATPVSTSTPEKETLTIPGTDVTFDMVRLDGGSFEMGSPEGEGDREADEGPQRMISVESFWIGSHEVTWDLYEVFRLRERDNAETTAPSGTFDPDAASRPSPPYEDPAFGMPKIGHPAVGMTQWGALQFAKWLTEKTGTFYRLPTEAEWEYACRAGTTSGYSFGDSVDDVDRYAWYYENSDESYQAVGTKEPNAWGLYDMHGNVSEWTMDQYVADYYASMPDSDPWSEPTRLHPRTVRGGAYDDDSDALRCANRIQSSMSWKKRDPQLPKSFWWNTDSPFVGFRLVRPVNQPSADEIEAFWLLNLGG